MKYISREALGKIHHLLLIMVLFLIFLHTFSSASFIQATGNLLKVISWIIALLWIPFWFLRILSTQYKPVISLIISAAICIFFAYGSIIGIILIFLLLLIPLSILLSQKSNSFDNSKFRKLIFLPMLISLGLSFLLTKEPIWFAGIIIWGIWAFTSNISYNYFLPVFGVLSKHDFKKGEIKKDPLVFISILVSSILVILINITSISIEFLRELYFTSAQISLTLVGFLLAVQGVLSNSSLKSKTDRGLIFEEELILKSMDGLKGFMLIFLALFIISIVGALSTKSDMGITQLNTISILKPISLSLDNAFLFPKSMLFIGLLTMFSFSICYLYYLFLSCNLIVMPFRVSLLSRPVIIEEISDSISDKSISKNINNYLTNESNLNGKLIRHIHLNELDYGLFASCEIEVNFPDKTDLMLTSRVLSKILIEKVGVTKVNIWIRSMQGSLGSIKIFQVELDKEKLSDLEKSNDPVIMEQKFKEFGANFKEFAFKESQLL